MKAIKTAIFVATVLLAVTLYPVPENFPRLSAQSALPTSGTDSSSGLSYVELSYPSGLSRNIALNSNGTALAMSDDAQIQLFDMSLQNQGVLIRHTDTVLSVDWNGSFPQLASGAKDHTVKIWDTVSLTSTLTLAHTNPVIAVKWSPSGDTLATIEGNIIAFTDDGGVLTEDILRIWSIANGGELLESFNFYNASVSLQWSADGSRLLFSGSNHQVGSSILIWDIASSQIVNQIPSASSTIVTVIYSPSENYIAYGTTGNEAQTYIIEANTRRFFRQYPSSANVTSIAWSPDSENIVVGTLGFTAIALHNLPTEDYVNLEGHTDAIRSLDWSQDGNYLVSATSNGTVRVWTMNLPDLSGTPTVTPYPTLQPTRTATTTPTPILTPSLTLIPSLPR